MADEGAVNCQHYNGVKGTKTRRCCGGKLIKRTRIHCDKLGGAIYAETQCKADFCSHYTPKKQESGL